MYPTPWTTSVPPPTSIKPIVNSYENNMQTYPFFGANTMQNISVSNNSLIIQQILLLYCLHFI